MQCSWFSASRLQTAPDALTPANRSSLSVIGSGEWDAIWDASRRISSRVEIVLRVQFLVGRLWIVKLDISTRKSTKNSERKERQDAAEKMRTLQVFLF